MTEKRFHIADLLAKQTSELWEYLPQFNKFKIVFSDGSEVISTWKEAVYSSYAWDFFRRFPKTPVLPKHHVKTIIGKKRLNSNTHLKLLAAVIWDVNDYYPEIDMNQIARETYEKVNEMYNDLMMRLGEYVMSVDILDFIEVSEHPEILAANNNVEPTSGSINHVYSTIIRCLNEDPRLKHNQLSAVARSGIIKVAQLNQCIGPRGFLTDIDSTQFKQPVLRGYLDGIRLFHDSLIESRSASKSLIFSKKPLQDAEYFSRKLQLMDMIVQRLHKGDCGSQEYIHWHVRGATDKRDEEEPDELNDIEDDGEIANIGNPKITFSGDLERIVGKYYLDDTNTLRAIKNTDTHLIGKTIKMRSVLKCQHPDAYGICSTCFGDFSRSIPEHSNIGHMCCASMTQKSSQLVLSTKHYDASSDVEPLYISPGDRKYLDGADDKISYKLQKSLKGNIKLVIRAKQAECLVDILNVKNVDDLNLTRITQLTDIGLRITSDTTYEEVVIDVGLERRSASMSYAMLKYIKENRWVVDELGNIVIDLDKWNRDDIMMSLPLRQYNMGDHSRLIIFIMIRYSMIMYWRLRCLKKSQVIMTISFL